MGQQVGANGRDQPQMQRPTHLLAMAAGHLAKALRLAQHLARLGHQLQSRLGKQHLAAGALQKHHPQLLLQLADLIAQGGLADEAALGRPAKMALFGQSHQVFQIFEIHRHSLLIA